MKTIIKAILRFFWQSKLSFIGLFLLIFFSSATFTTLNNTTINLQSSYEKVAVGGNLHEFVINENFRYGEGKYVLNNNDDVGTVNIVNIEKTMNTSKSDYTYLTTFNLNSNLIENGDYAWTYAYKEIYDNYKLGNIDGQDDYSGFSTFLSFQTIITTQRNDINLTNWNNDDTFKNAAINIVANKKIELDEYVKQKYKQIYINKIESDYGVSVRNFNSLNINNTKQNIFFKIIETSTDYDIDKVVVYSGNNVSKPWNMDFSLYNTYTQKDYEDNKELSRELVPYLYRAEWSDSTISFDELLNYVNNNENYNPYTNLNGSIYVVDSKIKSQSIILKSILDSKGVASKGYTVSFNYSKAGLIPVSGNLEDFTSYEIILSPQYMDKLNKKSISYNEWTKHKSDKQKDFDNWLKTIPDENKINIDNQEFIIVGSGVSPDFMYPILSFENVIPNNQTEQIVYTNSSGYTKMVDSFRGNEQESFLVGIFNQPKSEWNTILNSINSITANYMGWPSNINAAYLYNDITNTFSPTALRLQFIPNIVKTITTVSFFLTSFIVLLSVFISIVIIQRFIQINRNSLGIMQANGYKKWEIILGVCILISIPVGIATILGYTIGFSVQGKAIQLLSNFWTLPTSIEPFSLLVMLPLLFIAIILFVLITISFTWFSLRGETAEFMKDDAKYKSSKISSLIKKSFSKFNIMVRFRAAIAFTSLWRVILLSIMSAGLMMSLTFSLDVLNTFTYAANKTYGTKNYNYSLNLFTPTLQAGQYYAVPYQSQGATIDKSYYFNVTPIEYSDSDIATLTTDQYISQLYFDSGSNYAKYISKSNKNYNAVFANNVLQYGNYHLVSQADLSEQNTEIMYLKNKSTSKAFVNLVLGIGNLSTNPWDLGIRLMPPNNANYANQAFEKLFSQALSDNENFINIGFKPNTTNNNHSIMFQDQEFETNTFYEYIKYFSKAYAVLKEGVLESDEVPKIDGISNITILTSEEILNKDSIFYDEIDSNKNNQYDYYLQFDNSKITGNGSSIIKTETNINFLNLLYEIYKTKIFQNNTYSINYGKLVVGSEEIDSKLFLDSQYTYVDFNIIENNNKPKSVQDNFNAIGILKNDERMKIVNKNNELISSKLWTYQTNDANTYPIIINEYVSEVYDISIGDTLKVSINNSADRYSRKYFNKNNPVVNFKVIDITTTYQGPEFFISQYDANKMLGLTINNVKPKVPTSADQISEYVRWDDDFIEYDYGNNFQYPNNTQYVPKKVPTKEEFALNNSGFNGVFSNSIANLREVTAGVSLYSPSGIYPGADKIDKNNATIAKVMSIKENLDQTILTTGFIDLADKSWEVVIDKIANIFGSSASFSIVSSATSKNASLNILNTISETANNIQNIVLAILIIISVVIVVVISSIIINDSMKLAAILKCLGLADRNNALSFLSVYFPVFVIGLIISIPLSMLVSFVYIQTILGFSGILLIINPIWWHYLLAGLGVIFIFAISYWTAWNKISKMNLTTSIK